VKNFSLLCVLFFLYSFFLYHSSSTQFMVFWVNFNPEDGDSTVLQNIGTQLPHGTTQKTTNSIFTTVKTSKLSYYFNRTEKVKVFLYFF